MTADALALTMCGPSGISRAYSSGQSNRGTTFEASLVIGGWL
ncbi:MAG TPA: hypothetical protein VGI39_07795 [Polyangiaceae bacterium]